jgi:hypothetical protein
MRILERKMVVESSHKEDYIKKAASTKLESSNKKQNIRNPFGFPFGSGRIKKYTMSNDSKTNALESEAIYILEK